ncbi:ASCH domain-containing protein [Thermococcus sp.]
MRGLIVREPFASWIVEGKKVWEIRKSRTRIRGRVLILTGGRAIGSVELTDVLGPFSPEELSRYEDRHLVDYGFLKKYSNGRKLYAWVLQNPEKFERPKPVDVPRGAQVWVRVR